MIKATACKVMPLIGSLVCCVMQSCMLWNSFMWSLTSFYVLSVKSFYFRCLAPSVKCSQLILCSFPAAGLLIWNDLLDDVTSVQLQSSFWQELKTPVANVVSLSHYVALHLLSTFDFLTIVLEVVFSLSRLLVNYHCIVMRLKYLVRNGCHYALVCWEQNRSKFPSREGEV